MQKSIAEQVVVVTGASSGIGREAAQRFAARGARVVLVGRNQEALVHVASEIARAGGDALPAPADVADWEQVQQVAQRAVERYGRIDTWVNDAGVAVYGSFEDTSTDEFRRVVDVNLMGQVYGAKAALPHLRQAGGGSLVGITSSVGQLPLPFLTAYGASKIAVLAFYNALRLEQERARSGVQVSVIMPAGVDTPFFEHAQTHLGFVPLPPPPVYTPGLVADAILYAAEHPTRQVVVGTALAAGLAVERVAPRLVERVLQASAYAGHRAGAPKGPAGPTNLWQPVPGKGAARGGLRATGFDPYTWLELHPRLRRAVFGATLVAIAISLLAFATDAAACRRGARSGGFSH